MIYVTGDMHGQKDRFADKQMKKLKKGDTLLICGDFGFIWDGSQAENKALDWLAKRRFQIAFVDGKHENFDLLKEYPEEKWHGGKIHRIRDNIVHLMRGEIFELEERHILAFGGGESEDKEFRIDQGRWWADEMPTISEMENAVANLDLLDRRVDYILTHEPPATSLTVTESGQEQTNSLRVFFKEMVREVSYDKWFFGSLHQDRKISAKHYALFNEVLRADGEE